MATLMRKSPAGAHKPFANYSHVVTAQGANKLVFCAARSPPIHPARYCRRTTSRRRPRW